MTEISKEQLEHLRRIASLGGSASTEKTKNRGFASMSKEKRDAAIKKSIETRRLKYGIGTR